MEKKDGVTLSVWVSQDVAETLDRIAGKIGITRSKLVSNLLDAGLDDVLLFEKSGVLSLSCLVRDFKESLKRNFQEDVELGQRLRAQLQ